MKQRAGFLPTIALVLSAPFTANAEGLPDGWNPVLNDQGGLRITPISACTADNHRIMGVLGFSSPAEQTTNFHETLTNYEGRLSGAFQIEARMRTIRVQINFHYHNRQVLPPSISQCGATPA